MTGTGRAGYRESGLGWPGGAGPASAQPQAGLGQSPAGGQPRPGLEAGLGFRLGRAHRLLRSDWEQAIADLGLSPPQAALLRVVAQRPGCGLRELARRMNTDAMNAKRLADHLQRAGLVKSEADPRHRQRRVLRPTGAGAGLAAELERRAAAQQRQLATLIGPAEVAHLLTLLDRVEAAVAASPPGSPGGPAPGSGIG